MIKRKLGYFSSLSFLAIMLFAWLLKSFAYQDYQQHTFRDLQVQGARFARLSLLSNQYDTSTETGFSQFLKELDSQSGIFNWHLLDGQNRLVDKRLAQISGVVALDSNVTKSALKRSAAGDNVSQHRIYFKAPKGHLLTLNFFLQEEQLLAQYFSERELFLSIAFIFLLVGIASYYFKWVYHLESYARYILANDSLPKEDSLAKSSNPISQTINQLILKNSLLLKEKIELTEQLRKMSFVDEVTELGNHLFFKAEFEVRLHNHDEPESGLFMLLAFPQIEREAGRKKQTGISEHQAIESENDILRLVANLLKQFVKDIPDALVARLRGRDFALLLPNQTRTDTDNLCKNLILQLDKAIFDATEFKEHFIDIGISAYKQGFAYSKVLAEADMALRNAQLQGANNWFMYGENLSDNKVRGSLKWRSFLQRILERGKLQLFAQPIHYFTTPTKTHSLFCHQEIYVRIQDDKELLTADTFLPMANQCGLAVEFDKQVLKGLIAHCLKHSEQQVNQRYSINLFISSLLDPHFIDWLNCQMSQFPNLANLFYFEVKETHLVQNLEKLTSVFSQLAGLGIHWTIEKYGSPDTSFSLLELLPIASVKIDRRVSHNVHSDVNQQQFLKSLLIELNNKKIPVFADGVETEADANYLKKIGISGAQGYYFGQPERLKKLEKFLKVV